MENRNDTLRDEKRAVERRLLRAQRRLESMDERLDELRSNSQLVLDHCTLRRGLRVVNTSAGYSMALARNSGGTVSRRTALSMLTSQGLDGEIRDTDVIKTTYLI